MNRTKNGAKVLSTIGLSLFMIASIHSAHGQAPPVTHIDSMRKPQRASLDHLYWHFLLYQNYLDRQADMREQAGRDGSFLRNHFQREIQFSDKQFEIVRQSGIRLEADLKTVDAQIKPIVDQDRLWIKQNGRASGPPPGHSQVQQLQKERETVIQAAVSRLNQELGPELGAALQTYIDIKWAPHVTVHTFHPHPHDPKDNRPVPSHMQARQ
jgi:hypothetical protein